jgi:hypothetical protein
MADDSKLKLVNDAPSMIVVLDAVTQAQAVLASYIHPSSDARDPRGRRQETAGDLGSPEGGQSGGRSVVGSTIGLGGGDRSRGRGVQGSRDIAGGKLVARRDDL